LDNKYSVEQCEDHEDKDTNANSFYRLIRFINAFQVARRVQTLILFEALVYPAWHFIDYMTL